MLRDEFPNFDGLVNRKRVCDFGCGLGNQAKVLFDIGCEVVGIDPNPNNLDVAVKNAGGRPVSFVDRPPSDMLGTFDIVISQNSMEHFSEPDKILAEMMMLLAPGGRLLITFGPPWCSPKGSHMHFFL